MESTQLTQFYNTVTHWPKSEEEMKLVADKIVALIEVPFCALFLTDQTEKLVMRFSDAMANEKTGAGIYNEFLKKQIQQAQSLIGQRAGHCTLKQIQLSSENTPWAGVIRANAFTIANLCGDIRPGMNPRDGMTRKDFGWLLIASEKPLSTRQEVVMMAIAHYLSELAVVTELEGVIHLRSQFLSIASHELKTPLTSIYGILQLQERILRMKKDETPEQQIERQHSFLRMVIRQVERLNELIDGLLDVSRIQSGRFVVDPSDTDIAVILQDLMSSRLNIIAQEAGVKLETDAPTHLTAWVDPVRMEEVVTNLVMNAIRFSPEGGVVWVRLRDENGSIRLSVRDQGPAVPMEDRERIFQPFERAHRTSRLGGLGLGLFISRQIAQLHGGNVSLVESIPGKGNLFEAYFPTRNVNLISASA